MKLKIGIFLMLTLLCNSFAFSANSLKVPSRYILKGQVENKNEENKSLKVLNLSKENPKPLCSVCCTYMVTDANGNVFNATACAGWFLTSCETAAIRACEKARNALTIMIE